MSGVGSIKFILSDVCKNEMNNTQMCVELKQSNTSFLKRLLSFKLEINKRMCAKIVEFKIYFWLKYCHCWTIK